MSLEGQPTATVERTKRPGASDRKAPGRKTAPKTLVLPPTLTVKRLAELTQLSPIDVIKQLMRNGVMASLNQVIDFPLATLVTSAFSIRVRQQEESVAAVASRENHEETDPSKLAVRSPVVTILGHVDHGKTTLLDTIRNSRVVATEVGNITQHIGAYQVKYDGKEITFLDTPGHEAFTAIRARGAHVTDIAVLVVAADDGVMPQTVEALDHAKSAGVPIVVAINKMDRPDADPDKVKRQLGEQGLVLEEWGGDVIAVGISATESQGIEELLENILVVAELAELKADPDRGATGVVIEAELDKARGPLATALVQSGTLNIGDCVVAGCTWGRVKAMFNDLGERIKSAGPSVPVEIMGFNSLPEAGDIFMAVSKEKDAKEVVETRIREKEVVRSQTETLTLEGFHAGINEGEVKELNLVLKADVQGSIEAVRSTLERLDDHKARVHIIHAGSGGITESDILLASASKAIVIGFATSAHLGVERLAEREGVEIRHYDIIYHLVEDIERALKGILESTSTEVVQGRAEVRTIFPMSRGGNIAGCMVIDGRITRAAMARVIRSGEIVHDGTISSLRHFKEEVNEMTAGYECGVGLGGYDDFQEGDVLETYRRERPKR